MKSITFILVTYGFFAMNAYGQLKVHSNGYVGIGASETPKGTLHVSGDLYSKGHVYLHAYEGDGTSGTAYLQARDKSSNTSIGLQFRTQNGGGIVEALKINPNGDVGIGGEPKPGYKFSTAPGAIAHFGSLVYIDPGNDGSPLRFDMYDEHVRFRPNYNNNGRIGSYDYQFYKIYGKTIYQNGSQITSDERMKENIVPVDNAIDKINQLRAVKFDFKADTGILNIKDINKREAMLNANKNKYGFIAQEVQMILPHVVEYDEDADVYSMSYIEIIPLITSAIQEQQKVINKQNVETIELLERIAKLENEVQMIKTNCCNSAKPILKSGEMEELDNSTQTPEPELFQNNPNPFSETTEIKYYLPETISNAMICIYDMNGKQLKCFNLQYTGHGSVSVDGNELDAGMYMYTLIADGKVKDTKRMILTN